MTALIAKKADGSFYTVEELQGTARQEIRGSKSLSEQTYIGVVQARPESSGDVEAKVVMHQFIWKRIKHR